ncbi:TonB-dependent receptor [Wenzhouxiangella sp. XN24]|uniref:TonB-dependent receptor n=1 Tax=Wenzhouxiangella sp. XN24 TaxID=2713569 RepID=UPI001F0DE560|nr:TonB-dependent receptor [Wenzhouxiangella sp. XN24]
MHRFILGGLAAALVGFPAAAQTSGPQKDPLDPAGLRPDPQPIGQQVTSGSRFNPSVSVIIDGGWYTDNVSGEAFEILREADGFSAGHGHGHEEEGEEHGGEQEHENGHGHSHGELERGFNLREVEIALAATVDPYFDAFVMFVFDGDEVELEEAFVTTRSLPAGLQAKFGKFLSDVGYINKQHPHSWDFFDRPLVSELLFGDHGIQETGVQLSWVAPTSQYLRLGVEALQGETEGIAAYIGEEDAVEGTARILEDAAGPRLFTGFAKFAPDLGYQHALQLGASVGYSSSFQQSIEEETYYQDHEGTANFWGLDGVYKYLPSGGTGLRGAFKLQGEYFYRTRDLDRRDVFFACEPEDLACDDPLNEFQPGDIGVQESFKDKQDGFYLQAVYGVAQRWTVGLRYDEVGLTNSTGLDGGEEWDSSKRYTAALNFLPTEFSRLRLQFARGDISVDDGEREEYNQVFLQLQVNFGAHGAHTF